MTEKRDIGYVSARCGELREGFVPSVKACTQKKCPDLKEEKYSGVRRKICGINGRIPGNLGKCPKEVKA
jgi:hypothetical protein